MQWPAAIPSRGWRPVLLVPLHTHRPTSSKKRVADPTGLCTVIHAGSCDPSICSQLVANKNGVTDMAKKVGENEDGDIILDDDGVVRGD
ncbi:hypothetical protein GCM10023088_32810 [Actinomadura verrucosospora]